MTDEVRRIAEAVLYEGYLLWPYRRSAFKNSRRWTFGGVFPEAYHRGRASGDRCSVLTECLIDRPEGPVSIELRFLHAVRREVARDGEPVAELVAADGRRHLPGEEVAERTVNATGRVQTPIDIPAGQDVEEVAGGTVVRSWRALRGVLTVRTRPVRPDVHAVTVEVRNTTPGDFATRDAALPCAFNSAHLVLRTTGGRFVSLADPPERLRRQAAACRNDGLWPALVGDDDTTVLAAPIVLPDHPRVAPESPGDMFDATEIDQLLTLSVLALGDEEKREIRDGDPRAREIVDRVAALSPDDLMRLNGAIREFRPLEGA